MQGQFIPLTGDTTFGAAAFDGMVELTHRGAGVTEGGYRNVSWAPAKTTANSTVGSPKVPPVVFAGVAESPLAGTFKGFFKAFRH